MIKYTLTGLLVFYYPIHDTRIVYCLIHGLFSRRRTVTRTVFPDCFYQDRFTDSQCSYLSYLTLCYKVAWIPKIRTLICNLIPHSVLFRDAQTPFDLCDRRPALRPGLGKVVSRKVRLVRKLFPSCGRFAQNMSQRGR